MKPIHVPQGEHGTVRVFSLSMAPGDAQNLRDDEASQRRALGVETLNTEGVEVFQISDLAGIGLVGYLREGVDAEEDALNRDNGRLSALDGWVMLVHASAFEGREATLQPAPQLTLIGTYAQTEPDRVEIDVLSDAAQPYSGTPDITPAQPARGSSGGVLIAVGLVVLAILVLWWLL